MSRYSGPWEQNMRLWVRDPPTTGAELLPKNISCHLSLSVSESVFMALGILVCTSLVLLLLLLRTVIRRASLRSGTR